MKIYSGEQQCGHRRPHTTFVLFVKVMEYWIWVLSCYFEYQLLLLLTYWTNLESLHSNKHYFTKPTKMFNVGSKLDLVCARVQRL